MTRNGAAKVLPDAELARKLVPTVLGLLQDKETLADMRESVSAMSRQDAAESIAEQLWLVARQRAMDRTGARQ